jgi:tetratricopeptide (TPR) repeat protein
MLRFITALSLTLRMVSPPSLVAQAPQGASGGAADVMQRANAAFANKDWNTAARLFGDVTRSNPTNAAAWFRLGASFESGGQFRDALGAYEHVATLGFQPLAVQLRLARTYTELQDTTSAFAHLRAAARLGFQAFVADSDPAFAPLRRSTGYARIVADAERTRYPCRDVHTFDYWSGTFDVNPWGLPSAPPTGVATNTREYDGCVIVEHFTGGSTGTHGMSISFYDVNRKVWRMVWNDDNNSSNDFEGTYSDGAMHLTGWVLDGSGKRILARNTLVNVSPDTVHQFYQTSPDSGKTWVTLGDGRYVRRRP